MNYSAHHCSFFSKSWIWAAKKRWVTSKPKKTKFWLVKLIIHRMAGNKIAMSRPKLAKFFFKEINLFLQACAMSGKITTLLPWYSTPCFFQTEVRNFSLSPPKKRHSSKVQETDNVLMPIGLEATRSPDLVWRENAS